MCQFLVTKVAVDQWLRDGLGEEDEPCTTCELFNYLKSSLEGEHEVVVARGKDPRVVKKEMVGMMVDAGMVDAEMTFFAINEAIDLTKDDDDEDIPLSELRKCEGKSLYEKGTPAPHPPLPLLKVLAPTHSSVCSRQVRLSLEYPQGHEQAVSPPHSAKPSPSPSPSPECVGRL